MVSHTPRLRQRGEPAIDGLARRKARRQHPPGNAAAQDVKDRVDDLTVRPSWRPTQCRSGRQQRLQIPPTRHPSRRWRSAGHRGYAARGWSGSTSAVLPTRSRQPVGITSSRPSNPHSAHVQRRPLSDPQADHQPWRLGPYKRYRRQCRSKAISKT